MSCLINNTITISDELINLICHNPEIQRMAIIKTMTKRIHSGGRTPVTLSLMADISAKLRILQENDQIDSVKVFIRDLLGHGFPNKTKSLSITPVMIDAIPSILTLQMITGRDLDQFHGNGWPHELQSMRDLFELLTAQLLDHVHPTPPDLRHMISGSDEKFEC